MKEKLSKDICQTDLRIFNDHVDPVDLIKQFTKQQQQPQQPLQPQQLKTNPIKQSLKQASTFEQESNNTDPFYIVDLEDVCNKHINWITKMPRVEPHYAIKCNTDVMMLKLLAFLGAGFDCASKHEIQQVLDLGVSPHRIIFANPCKQASMIRYAHKAGVDYMTFDNEAELHKIKANHPTAKCVLRIITNDQDAVCKFSMKFGADMYAAPKLIDLAMELGLDLVGVSFHVGSGQMSPRAFSESIENARRLFDYARETHGCRSMHLLDLGGGYAGSPHMMDLFDEVAAEINRSLERFFPADTFDQLNGNTEKLRVIAEPGRYYACSAFTLCVSVIAKRVVEERGDDTAKKSVMYYINDGVYASFNCLFYDHAECTPVLIDRDDGDCDERELYKSSIWGPTCDGLDLVNKEIMLPELDIGAYMVFKNMGAYTISGAVAFNGIPLAKCIYVASTSWETIKNAFVEQSSDVESTVAAAAATGETDVASSCAIAAACLAPSDIDGLDMDKLRLVSDA